MQCLEIRFLAINPLRPSNGREVALYRRSSSAGPRNRPSLVPVARESMEFLPDYFTQGRKPASRGEPAWSIARTQWEDVAKEALCRVAPCHAADGSRESGAISSGPCAAVETGSGASCATRRSRKI